MRTSRFAIATIAVACTFGTSACRRRDGSPAPAQAAAVVSPAVPAADTGFTPPEIRRQDADTALVPPPTQPASAPEAAPVAQPARPAVVPPAAPPPKAQPAPARPEPSASPAPATRPTAVVADGPAASQPAPEPGPEGDWVLQVNVHKSEAEADAQVAKLGSQGIPAYSVAVPSEGAGLAGRYWRVRVGRFRSRADAQAYGQRRIASKGLKFWIDRKSNETRAVGGGN